MNNALQILEIRKIDPLGVETVEFDLLNGGNGVYLDDWKPSRTPLKSGGVFQDSPLADGRTMVFARRANGTEKFRLKYNQANSDGAIYQDQELERVLELAIEAELSRGDLGFYYIAELPKGATNEQYARIINGQLGPSAGPHSYLFSQEDEGSTWVNIDLMIERGQWGENPPSQGTAAAMVAGGAPISESDYENRVLALEPIGYWKGDEGSGSDMLDSSGNGYDGSYTSVVLTDDNIFPGTEAVFFSGGSGYADMSGASGLDEAFNGLTGTAIMWVRQSGLPWTSGNRHTFMSFLGPSGREIVLRKGTTDNRVEFRYDIGTISITLGFLTTTTNYFCVGARWETDGNQFTVSIWYNGAKQDEYTFSSSVLWDVDPTTMVFGADDTVPNNSSQTNVTHIQLYDRALTDAEIASVSSLNGDESTSSEDRTVFAVNNYLSQDLTHIFNFDDSLGTFGSNLVESTPPFSLFPSSPAVDDIVYFGIQSGGARKTNPFNVLAFYLSQDAQSTTSYTITWEIWTGASWGALGTVGGDVDFDFIGGGLVYFSGGSSWATTSINGITAWWVRARLSALSGTFTRPTQSTRTIYALTKPYVTLPATSIGGDMNSPIRLRTEPEGGAVNYYIVGLRKTARGEEFPGLLTAVQDPNGPPGVICTAPDSDASFTSTPNGYGGEYIDYSPSASSSSWDTVARWTIGAAMATQYRGGFHWYAIVEPDTGVSISQGDFAFRRQVTFANDTENGETFFPVPISSAAPQLVDLGSVSLPLGQSRGSVAELVLNLQMAPIAGNTKTYYIHGIFLLPIDEWAGLFYGNFETAPYYMDISSLTGRLETGFKKAESGDYTGPLVPITNGLPRVNHNQRQRLFMMGGYQSNNAIRVNPHVAMSIRLDRNQRYKNLRGNR